MEKEFDKMIKINFKNHNEKTILIPNKYIYDENNNYQIHFLYFMQHVADANPFRFQKNDDGLLIFCPIKKSIDEHDDNFVIVPPCTTKFDLFQSIYQRMKETQQKYSENNLFLYQACNKEKFFFWLDLKKSIWWMKEDKLIDCQDKTKLTLYLKWFNFQIKDSVKYSGDDLEKLRKEAKRLRSKYDNFLSFHFPEPDLSKYKYFLN